MDIFTESKPDSKRSRSFLAVLQTIRGFIGGLIGVFTLTDAERLEAGVIVRNK